MLENLFITVTNSEKKNYVKCNLSRRDMYEKFKYGLLIQ